MKTSLDSPGSGGAAFPDSGVLWAPLSLSDPSPFRVRTQRSPGPTDYPGTGRKSYYTQLPWTRESRTKIPEIYREKILWYALEENLYPSSLIYLEMYLFAFPQLFQWHTSPISWIHTAYNFNTNSVLKLNLPEILPHLFFILVDNNTNRS